MVKWQSLFTCWNRRQSVDTAKACFMYTCTKVAPSLIFVVIVLNDVHSLCYCSQHIPPISKEVWVLENEKRNKIQNRNRSTTILQTLYVQCTSSANMYAVWCVLVKFRHRMFVFNIICIMFISRKLFGKMKMCAMHCIHSPHMNIKY